MMIRSNYIDGEKTTIFVLSIIDDVIIKVDAMEMLLETITFAHKMNFCDLLLSSFCISKQP